VLEVYIHPAAYKEMEASFNWYEEKAENLGKDFFAEIKKAIENIKTSPKAFPKYLDIKGLRRFLLHRFPFAIIYRIKNGIIQVIAIMHLKRKPYNWKDRF